MVRFLHTADWQLGMTRHFLKGEAQARFSAARLDAIEQMGNIAVNEGCEFVVVCGDVFESNQIDRQILVRALNRMEKTPSVTFYLLPGNHDPLDASSIYLSERFKERKPENVKVLDGSEPVVAAPGVELIAAPWPNKRPTTDLVNEACQGLKQTDAVRIVVGHGATDDPNLSPNRKGPELISLQGLREKIEAGLIQFVALGDRHSKTDVGETGRVWYAGAPEPTSYRETDPGNVLIVDVDAVDVSVEARRLAKWQFVEKPESDLSSDGDIDNLAEWLSRLEKPDRTIVKLTLVGQVSLAQNTRLDRILKHYGGDEEHGGLVAALEVSEGQSGLVVVPNEIEVEDLGLSGFARNALEELSKKAEAGEESSVARDALVLLYRLARSQK